MSRETYNKPAIAITVGGKVLHRWERGGDAHWIVGYDQVIKGKKYKLKAIKETPGVNYMICEEVGAERVPGKPKLKVNHKAMNQLNKVETEQDDQQLEEDKRERNAAFEGERQGIENWGLQRQRRRRRRE